MLKRVVSLIVGASCAFAAMGVSAIDVVTKSTYDSENNIKVESSVNGVTQGDILTYLAYRENASIESLTGDQIVYIDQKDADSGTVTFTYVTQESNIGSHVKVGGIVDNTPVTPTIDGVIEGLGCKVSFGGKTITVSETTGFVKFETMVAVSAVMLDDVPLNAADGDWFAATDGIWINAELFDGLVEAAVTITEDTATEVLFETKGLAHRANDELVDESIEGANSVIAVGKVEGPAKSFGILFGKSKDEVENYNAGGTPFKALGKGSEGLFAIKLYNYAAADDNPFTDSDVAFARTFCEIEAGVYEYGEIFTVDITKDGETKGEKVEEVTPQAEANNIINAVTVVDLPTEEVDEVPVTEDSAEEPNAEEPADTNGEEVPEAEIEPISETETSEQE